MAGERQQVLTPALRAAQAREAPVQPTAVEVGLDGARDDRAQCTGRALEALLVAAGVLVEVAIEEPVQCCALRVAGAVGRLGLAGKQRERRTGRSAAARGGDGCETGGGHGRRSAGRDTWSHSLDANR
jgi:hypothetical protein